MILAIDAGNSRVKWGWHDGRQWANLATVSLIEFAAASHDINPFAATHEEPESEKVVGPSEVAGAIQLVVENELLRGQGALAEAYLPFRGGAR